MHEEEWIVELTSERQRANVLWLICTLWVVLGQGFCYKSWCCAKAVGEDHRVGDLQRTVLLHKEEMFGEISIRSAHLCPVKRWKCSQLLPCASEGEEPDASKLEDIVMLRGGKLGGERGGEEGRGERCWEKVGRTPASWWEKGRKPRAQDVSRRRTAQDSRGRDEKGVKGRERGKALTAWKGTRPVPRCLAASQPQAFVPLLGCDRGGCVKAGDRSSYGGCNFGGSSGGRRRSPGSGPGKLRAQVVYQAPPALGH